MKLRNLFRRILSVNITIKFIGYLILVSIVPFFVVGLISYQKSRTIIQETIANYTAALIEGQKNNLDLRLEEVENLIGNLSGVEDITNVLNQKSSDVYTDLATQARIGYILNNFSNIKGLASIDIFTMGGAHYHVGDTLNPSNVRQDIIDRIFSIAKNAGTQIVWAGIEDNINLDSSYQKVITAARLFTQFDPKTNTQSPTAVLLVNYRVDYLYERFSSVNLGEGGYLVIVDNQNKIVYHPDPSLIGGSMGASYLDQMSAERGSLVTEIQGQEMSITYTHSALNNWLVAFFIPMTTLTAPVLSIATSSGVVLGFCLLLVVILTLFYTRTVVIPIRQITRAFQMNENKPQGSAERLFPKSQDEIGELVRWFNTFLDNQFDKQRTEESLRQREHYLSLLNDITLAALKTSNLQDMLRTLATRMVELLNAKTCKIFYYDQNNQTVVMSAEAHTGIEKWDSSQDSALAVLVKTVMAKGHPISIPEGSRLAMDLAQNDSEFPEQALLGLPLMAVGEELGAIVLFFNRERRLSLEEIAYGEQAAAQISLAILRATLMEEAQKRANMFENLYRTAQDIGSVDSLPILLERIVGHSTKLLNAPVGFIFLHDPAHQEMELCFVEGAATPTGTRLGVGEGITGQVAVSHLPILLNDPRDWTGDLLQFEGNKITSIVLAPMLWGSELIGVIGVAETEPTQPQFVEMDMQLLSLLAGQGASEIKKTQIVFETQRFNEELAKGITERTLQLENANNELKQERELLSERVNERTAELSAANAEMAFAVRSKDEFLANMSHELRTPLNAVLGLTEALEEEVYGSMNGQQIKSLHTIEESGQHLLSLINDILDLSKIEAGKLDTFFTRVAVEPLCQASLQFIKQISQKKGILVTLTIDPGIEDFWADERRMKQILVNLLTNAVKFTNSEGQIGLEVRRAADEDALDFSVWDTGIGISAEDQSHLFVPFVQIDSGLNRQHEGTGLGLALVSRLAMLHGGKVILQSEEGQGSRFTVRIPAKSRSDSEEAENALSASSPITTYKSVSETKTLLSLTGPDPLPIEKPVESADPIETLEKEPPLILLAEDNDANIFMMRDFLQRRGYRVNVAHNGIEAEELALQQTPALILMDVQMPERDGLEATRRLRLHPGMDKIPIIALTALVMPGDAEMCLAAGVNDYMTKPVRLKNLAEIIEKCIHA